MSAALSQREVPFDTPMQMFTPLFSKQKVHQAHISVSMIPRGMKYFATKFLKLQLKLLFSKLSCQIYTLGAALSQREVPFNTPMQMFTPLFSKQNKTNKFLF